MPQEPQKAPFVDRAIGFLSPKWAAERAYYREALRALPKLIGSDSRVDERSFPRSYERDAVGNQNGEPPATSAIYTGSLQSRVDRGWPMSRALKGVNAPLNRWRLLRLRDRARELDRNNALVNGMLWRATENVISHGMGLRPTTDNEKFNAQVSDLWEPWLENADITGEQGAGGFQRLFHRCHLRDGDVGMRLVRRGKEYFVQAVEGDLIDTATGGYDLANNVIHGVQFNGDNRAVAYWVMGIALDGVQYQSERVPASDFIFYPRKHGFSEVRGEPCFAQVDRIFDQIDGYVEASVIAARVAACQALLIKKTDGGKIIANLPTQLNAKNNPQKIESFEPGMVKYLNPGEEVEQVRPEHPTQQFSDFLSTILRFTGLTLGLPLELIFLDFSRTTYSSARASLLQAYRSFRSQQQIFIDRVMSKLYRWRLDRWIDDGVLKVPARISGNYWRHEWIAPGWAWIDPVKEIQAAMMEVDAGFNSEENVCMQHGRTLSDVLASKNRAKQLAQELSLDLSRSGLTREAIIAPKPQTKANPPTGELDEPQQAPDQVPEGDD